MVSFKVLCLLVSLILLVIGIILYTKSKDEENQTMKDAGFMLMILGGPSLLASILGLIFQ